MKDCNWSKFFWKLFYLDFWICNSNSVVENNLTKKNLVLNVLHGVQVILVNEKVCPQGVLIRSYYGFYFWQS